MKGKWRRKEGTEDRKRGHKGANEEGNKEET
jgi:hypothetical protein